MTHIQKLPDHVINQIAAGEVVENPASLIKELVENSLDAGATEIFVSVELGGIQSIVVEDNGSGMTKEDALLSIQRHATSKIREIQDLEQLLTMGFRGEALAAIAAVSTLTLTTQTENEGTSLLCIGGVLEKVEVAARALGTTIQIDGLFFNTPARKKFLKSPKANTAQIKRMLQTIALAHPEKSFSLHSNGSPLFAVFEQSPKERIDTLLKDLDKEISYGPVYGWISTPNKARPHRKEQYLFINQRPLFSPLISHAVKVGYKTRLPEQSYPSFALFLTLPPEEMDINVHPQKKEVRFSDEKKIFSLFEAAIAASFEESSLPSFDSPLVFERPSFSFEKTLPSSTQEEVLSFDFVPAPKPLTTHGHYLLIEDPSLQLIDLHLLHAPLLEEQIREGKKQDCIPAKQLKSTDNSIPLLESLHIQARQVLEGVLAIDTLPLLFPEEALEMVLPLVKKHSELPKLCLALVSYKKTYTLEEARSLYSMRDVAKKRSSWSRSLLPTHLKKLFQEASCE